MKIFGKGDDTMSSIYLVSRQNYHDCKSLIFCMFYLKKKVNVNIWEVLFPNFINNGIWIYQWYKVISGFFKIKNILK